MLDVDADLRTEPRPDWRRLGLLVAAWCLAITCGVWQLLTYANTEGTRASPPDSWPKNVSISAATDKATLLLFAHPHCPCTNASVTELGRLLAHWTDRLDAHVVFFQPDADARDWEDTRLWTRAAALPGVRIHADPDQDLVDAFDVATSGQVVLYDSTGKLRFCGGITGSRGHEGDNAGASMIHDLLGGHANEHATSPVFGCPLHESAPMPAEPGR